MTAESYPITVRANGRSYEGYAWPGGVFRFLIKGEWRSFFSIHDAVVELWNNEERGI